MDNKKKYEAEIQFLDVLKSPMRLFGWIYPYFVGVILLVGIFYLRNLDDISRNEAPETILDRAEVARTVKKQAGAIIPPINLELVKSADNDLLAKGKEVFSQNCASCHGEEGMGDGEAGANLDPKPRNFHSLDGWTNGAGMPEMYGTLQKGIAKNGMAAYEYLPVEEKIAVIHFIRSYADYPEITDEQVQLMDMEYKLSAGEQRPNRIPVDVAVNKLLDENSGLITKTSKLVKLYREKTTKSQLLVNCIVDEHVVFSSLLKTNLLDDVNKLREAVSYSPNEMGFNSKVVTFNDDNWNELYNKLKEFVEEKV